VLATHLHLAPRLNNKASSKLPLSAFMADNRKKFTFFYVLLSLWLYNIFTFLYSLPLRIFAGFISCLHDSALQPRSKIYWIWRSCDLASWKILIIKPTRCTNFLNLLFRMKIYMFRTAPLSFIRRFSLYTQQWYTSYSLADSLRAGSGSEWNWSWFCSQAVCKNIWHISLLCVK
jgi:hypothetical protein